MSLWTRVLSSNISLTLVTWRIIYFLRFFRAVFRSFLKKFVFFYFCLSEQFVSSCVYDCVSIIQRFNNPNTPKVYSLLQRDFSLTLNLTTTLPLTLLLVERKCGDWVNVFWSARGKTLKFSDYRIAFRLSSCPRVCRSVAVEAAC